MTSDFMAELAAWVERVVEQFRAVFRALAERLKPLLEQASRFLDQVMAKPDGPGYLVERWPRRRAPRQLNPGRGLSASALGRPLWRPVR